ncbi:hypothetical protein GQ43DRAFT_453716 [Delitschia confertaspora ATCC 74209]|uniref:AGC-kinase C-terminal domain-containing protein n=1 Tax=Delitschia confertaspora ATCC 74209 TaxID=1513339 RepID=A0A9P4JST3_9PLEO|nr:hypothetical protein GQ43DRAFT_453716 [Delitschia confertaspora ATCC 74209]
MAPSNMFSYLRHNRRNTPSVPSQGSPSASPQPIPSPALQSNEYFSSRRIPDGSSLTSGSPVSTCPPMLPPIRVASPFDESQAPALVSPQPRISPPSPNIGSGGYVQKGEELSKTRSLQEQLPPKNDSKRPSSSRSTGSNPPATFEAILSGIDENAYGDPQLAQQFLQPPKKNTVTNNPSYSRSQSSLVSSFTDKSTNLSKSNTLNLRNPMSLLLRRRSSQTLDNLSDDSLVSHRTPTLPAMPDDYDPRIRGHIVHDFSAPRPNRNFSYNNAYGSGQEKSNAQEVIWAPAGRVSPTKLEREHTPIFREHFDDDTSYEASQAAIRAEQLANNDFVNRNSFPPPERSPPALPPLPKHSPPIPPQPMIPLPPLPNENMESFASSVLSPVQESPSPTDVPAAVETPMKKKSTKTPPSSRSRAASVTDPAFVPAGLPAHLTSRASRFSFQIAGSDSAQEKLLEDRHKQKAAEKASKHVRMSTNTLEDEFNEDMYDYDMDDGGYEEEIPMIGDDEGFGDGSMSPGMSAFDFTSFAAPLNITLSPNYMNGDTPHTPHDVNGNAIGFAVSDNQSSNLNLPKFQSDTIDIPSSDLNGLGLTNIQPALDAQAQFTSSYNPEETTNSDAGVVPSKQTNNSGPDDDLYFDDGMISDQDKVIESQGFDENLFDDPSGPFFKRPVNNLRPADLYNGMGRDPNEVLPTLDEEKYRAALMKVAQQQSLPLTGHYGDLPTADEDGLTAELKAAKQNLPLARQPSMAQQNPIPDLASLNAYHSALAEAASKAQAEGRFVRKASIGTDKPVSEDAEGEPSLSDSRPSLIPEDGHFNQETTGYPDDFGMSSAIVDDYDYSDYDSAFEDDPMIAAANAEALANDYEGFYGQEFGFYASGQSEAQQAWGGYFGSSGLGRNPSGRNAVREPNLTPITERSEYSTRNSFISLNHFRDGQQPMQSPALAQLARISPYGWLDEDPDMSMDSLMKLRKGAFGASSASLGSSPGTSPRNSSCPAGASYMPRNASPMTNYALANSDFEHSDESVPISDDMGYVEDDEALDAVNAGRDDYSQYSDDEEEMQGQKESPTLTASDYHSMSRSAPNSNFKPTLRQISLPPTISLPPHPLQRSSTDSVTYVREHDEQGTGHWVLERRRTAESGELELVGREIVEGGRI